MKNESRIKGDGNYVFQGTNKSKIDVSNKTASERTNYSLIGIIITIMGLIATIIIGWDSIIKFFNT